MRTISLMLMVLLISYGECMAQDQTENVKLIEAYFNAAVEADGDDYFDLREKVLQYGEEVITFLQNVSGDERPKARVIARALLAWLELPDSKGVRSGAMKELNEALNTGAHGGYLIAGMNALSDRDRAKIQASFPQLHDYDMIGFDVTSLLRRRGGFEVGIMAMAPHRIEAMDRSNVFLLEAAIKGFPRKWREQIVNHPQGTDSAHQLARGYAAALAGGLSCQDASEVLVQMLKSEESWVVRLGAARGLELMGNKAIAIPNLILALNDDSPKVRLATFLMLRRLAGVRLDAPEFMTGRTIEPHHIEAAERWWAENKGRVEREQIENPPSRKKVIEEPPEPIEQQIERHQQVVEEALKHTRIGPPTEEEMQRFIEQKEALLRQIREDQKKSAELVDITKDPAVDSD
jgi:hypothetical protein